CRLECEELRAPANRRGADPHLRTNAVGAAKCVERIIPSEIGPDGETFGLRRRHVLRGVNRNVDPSVQQRLFELLGKHAPCAELAERLRAIPVAGGGDGYECDLKTVVAEMRRGKLGLREREPTSAGADADQHGRLRAPSVTVHTPAAS